MSDDWRDAAYHRPGSALVFPRDEGWHRTLPGGLANPSLDHMEWVYLNAHVQERGGERRRFVIFAAYFTQGLRFLVVRAFTEDRLPLEVHTGTAIGLLRVSTTGLDLRFDHGGGDDRWVGHGAFASTLTAHDDAGAFGLELAVKNTKRPYEAGGLGALPFGADGSFFYYSLTRLTVSGRLELPLPGGGEESVQVEGIGWFDHQWGQFYVTPFQVRGVEQYEWMSIQLDSGDELMLTTVWEPTGHTPCAPGYGGAGLIRRDGTWDRLVGSDRWRRRSFWTSPHDGDIYACRWTFDAPEWDCHLDIEPLDLDQLTPIVDAAPGRVSSLISWLIQNPLNLLGSFWEGTCRVTGRFGGAEVEGVAFGELVKRYARPVPKIEIMRTDGPAVLCFTAHPIDDQVALRYDVEVTDSEGHTVHAVDDLEVPILTLDGPAGEPLVVRVVARSEDGTLAGVSTESLEIGR